MNIHFYNVPPHVRSYSATVPSLSETCLISAFLHAINAEHRHLTVDINDDRRHGKIILSPGRVVALFDVDL